MNLAHDVSNYRQHLQYTYDKIDQLKVADSATASEDRGYLYDAARNLNKRTNNTTVTTFTVDSKNQLTAGPTSPYTYDSNGNLTGYNTYFYYTYDAENRMTSWEYSGTAKTEFVYDGLGRLRVRKEFTSYPWYPAGETRYIYDGWRVIQERDDSNLPTVSYTRGTDLSGSLEGAGGIGGLLARSHNYSGGNWSTHNFYHADGNGNVTYLVNSGQTLAASYRYDAYGNTISSSGSLAGDNTYRFSSKMIFAVNGLYYYGYRWYDPNLQRWLNRDPIAERGGLNLYGFVMNSPVDWNDPFGTATRRNISITPLPTRPTPYQGCNDDQKKFIKDGMKKACETINHECFAQCLNDPGLVQKLKEKCSKPEDTLFSCSDSKDPDCAGVCAYASEPGTRITLCPDYNKCKGGAGCTILHELAHNAGAKGDRANDVEKCGDNCNQNPPPHPK